jgi:ribonuclease D
MRYETIEDEGALKATVERLRGEPLLGVDTEAAGYHRFFDRMSLVQLSSRGENFLVDPLAIDDLSPLAELFEDPAVEKVFHDADYDLRILDRDAGMGIRGLFDTQIAAAFLGERQLGLGNIVEKYLGLKLPKEFQRADWAERPLSAGMMEYAATDTAHLPDLRDRLKEALEERGRLHWAEEEFRRREGTRWSEPEDRKEAFMRIKGARDLAPRGLAILRELHAWREEVARERDQATFRILSNQALLELSAAPRSSVRELASVTGISEGMAQRRGRDILAAVERGQAVPEEELPRWPRGPRFERDPELEARVESLRDARSRAADRLELDAGFLIARATLEEIAKARPADRDALAQVSGMRAWQVEAAGDALLAALGSR